MSLIYYESPIFLHIFENLFQPPQDLLQASYLLFLIAFSLPLIQLENNQSLHLLGLKWFSAQQAGQNDLFPFTFNIVEAIVPFVDAGHLVVSEKGVHSVHGNDDEFEKPTGLFQLNFLPEFDHEVVIESGTKFSFFGFPQCNCFDDMVGEWFESCPVGILNKKTIKILKVGPMNTEIDPWPCIHQKRVGLKLLAMS